MSGCTDFIIALISWITRILSTDDFNVFWKPIGTYATRQVRVLKLLMKVMKDCAILIPWGCSVQSLKNGHFLVKWIAMSFYQSLKSLDIRRFITCPPSSQDKFEVSALKSQGGKYLSMSYLMWSCLGICTQIMLSLVINVGLSAVLFLALP
jgi:hypothetical protein